MNVILPNCDDEAAAWVARMSTDDWSDSDEAALEGWLAADPSRSGALLKVQALWAIFEEGAVPSNGEGAPANVSEQDIDSSVRSALFSRRWLLGGSAFAIAASLAGAFELLQDPHYTTAIGEIRRVPLTDGSVASINTNSAIKIELKPAQREVELSRGEAWFQVAKDPSRPFIVEAGRVRAQAIGTAFSVRRRTDGADVVVTEGVVEAWADGAEGNRIRLNAGQSAFVSDDAAIHPIAASASALDRSLAWRGGKIDLVAIPLAEAAEEFNRYNARQIEIVDPALRGEQLDGVFGTNDPETFAIAVRDGLSVPVDMSDPKLIRIGQAPH